MNLTTLLMGLAAPLVRQVLISLGIGVLTFVGLDTAISGALGSAKGMIGQIPAAAFAILARGGVFTAMSIIAGGITAGISLVSLKKFAKVA